jgi:signal transduction histidine kinase
VATAVTLRYQPRALTVEIRNAAGSGHAPPTAAGGHGLMGIRERVAMYGGDLQAGPSSAGGYTLQVRLPLERDST